MPNFYIPITDPTWIFFTVLGIILLAPIILERLRIPAIVGMIVAGVVVGPHGAHVLNRDASFEIFGKVGIYYIMFLASLEMNLADVMKNRTMALGYGLLSFALPFGLGLVANLWLLGLSWPAALMVSCMYSAHTLLTYPLIMRWGLGKHRAVGIAVGGTIVTDVITLLILALIGGTSHGGNDNFNLGVLVLKVLALGLVVVWTFPRVCRWFFRRVGDSVMQYIFVLLLVFLGAGLMEWVGMEGILGAFLVGLVLNREIPPASPLMHHIEMVGNALFIPYFLIGVGMLINVQSLFTDWSVWGVAGVMIAAGTLTKWLAARVSKRIFRFTPGESSLIFGLSTARAAATLAIALVGYDLILPNGDRLLGDDILNASMLLILGSCVIASMVTERAAQKIVLSGEARQESTGQAHDSILIALRNPHTVIPMVNMGLVMRTPNATATVSAVTVVLDNDAAQRSEAQQHLDYAAKMAAAIHVRMHTHCRWSVNPVTGIYHAANESEASDILVGLHHQSDISDSFWGKFATDLIAKAQQQIMLYRPLVPIYTLRRIHVVVPHKAEFDPGFRHWCHRLATLTSQVSSRLSVYSRPTTLEAVRQCCAEQRHSVEASYHDYTAWNDFLPLADQVRADHMVVFITARKGMPSHHRYIDTLPQQLERYFSARSVMV
ncbi:MAG: cation:proton antiporter, partial [Bacteroidaceae bacterium]|nr:cation:proton antiporter [Bacteroidaceae bacterium]